MGSKVTAPEVFLFAKVLLEPETPRGSALRFEDWKVSLCAARESEAIGPAFSRISGAVGSLT